MVGDGKSKKKRVSKKNKVAWRKHVDISDVDNFLEEQRLEERIGKPLQLFKDEELFHVDKTPSTKTQPKVLTSKQEKRLRLLNSEPKCFSFLKPHTNVPDPIRVRNRVRTKEERKNALIKKKEALMREKGILKAKERRSLKDRQIAEQKRVEAKNVKWDDIWESKEIKVNHDIQSDLWVDDHTKKHSEEATGIVKKPRPFSLKHKPSIIPAIEVPHPGTSYNPSYQDHRDLLGKVVEKEKKIIKEEAHLNRVTRDMFRKVTVNEKENSWIVEMSEGLNQDQVKEEESDGEYKPLNPPVQNKKKTLQQRRKQKEQVEQERMRRQAKLEKKKVADIYKLKFIKKSLDKQDLKLKRLQDKRKLAEARKAKEAKRLGANKFEEQDIVFSYGQDLTGALRTMKKEGNLLFDRFKSMQKRNMLEPTAIRKVKKAKVKKFVRHDHKDDWKKTVAKSF